MNFEGSSRVDTRQLVGELVRSVRIHFVKFVFYSAAAPPFLIITVKIYFEPLSTFTSEFILAIVMHN